MRVHPNGEHPSMEGSYTAIKVPMGTWRDGAEIPLCSKDATGSTVISKAAVMTVGKADTAPVITTQPESVTQRIKARDCRIHRKGNREKT